MRSVLKENDMNEQDELLEEITDTLSDYMSKVMGRRWVATEISKFLLAKVRPVIGKQERERIFMVIEERYMERYTDPSGKQGYIKLSPSNAIRMEEWLSLGEGGE